MQNTSSTKGKKIIPKIIPRLIFFIQSVTQYPHDPSHSRHSHNNPPYDTDFFRQHGLVAQGYPPRHSY